MDHRRFAHAARGDGEDRELRNSRKSFIFACPAPRGGRRACFCILGTGSQLLASNF